MKEKKYENIEIILKVSMWFYYKIFILFLILENLVFYGLYDRFLSCFFEVRIRV